MSMDRRVYKMKDLLRTIVQCSYLHQEMFNKTAFVPTVLGILTSIWSSTTFIAILEDRMSRNDNFVFDGVRHTHYTLMFATSLCLIYGLSKRKRYLLLPWIQFKILECLLYFISMTWFLISSNYYARNKHFIYVGLINMIFIVCLIWSVWKSFKTMPDSPPEYEEAAPRKSDAPPNFEDVTKTPPV